MGPENYIPLTLEQLKEIDGQTILISDMQGNIIDKGFVRIQRNFVSGENRIKYYFESFGKTWNAYAYGCGICKTTSWAIHYWKQGLKYCPHCGRPLTLGAWAELKNS